MQEMPIKRYLEIKEERRKTAKEQENEINNFFRGDNLYNLLIQYRKCRIKEHTFTVFFFPIPDVLDNSGNEIFHYIILYNSTNFFKTNVFHGTQKEMLKEIKTIIENDYNNLKL